jgi:hypothetical protein
LLHVDPSSSLPSELAHGMTVAVGPSIEHRSLHLAHPLAVAAIASARAECESPGARISLAADAPAELSAHRGKRAHLRLIKLAIDGFERVELLVPVVVLEDGALLDFELALALLRAAFAEDSLTPSAVFAEDVLSDAVSEVLFGIQAALDRAEHTRFERAAQQAERFIEDRLLVCKRRRQKYVARLEEAQRQREGATGAAARGEADLAVLKAQTDVDEVDAVIARLSERDDDVFRRYREHIHERRYAPPQLQKLFDLELAIT